MTTGWGRGVEHSPLTRLQRDWVHVLPAQLWPGPEGCLVCTPSVIIVGPGDRVLFAGKVVHGKARGKRLLVERIGVAQQGVHLAGLLLALGPYDVLNSTQFQQVAQFGGVEDIGRANDNLVSRPLT